MNWSPPSTASTAFTASSINTTQSRTINLNNSDFITPQPFYLMNNNLSQENFDNVSRVPSSSSSSSNDLEQRRIANELALFIRQSNLKLIAFDFDQTIVSVHTGGFWRESVEKLVEHVRSEFQYLITELLKIENLSIAIVTFSPQSDLIREVLRLSIKINDNVLNRIIIQGNTKEFVDKYGLAYCYYNGKQTHITTVKERFEAIKNYKILNEDILLIDDDTDNVNIARKNGHLAFEVGNTFTLNELQEFLNRVYGIEKPRLLKPNII